MGQRQEKDIKQRRLVRAEFERRVRELAQAWYVEAAVPQSERPVSFIEVDLVSNVCVKGKFICRRDEDPTQSHVTEFHLSRTPLTTY